MQTDRPQMSVCFLGRSGLVSPTERIGDGESGWDRGWGGGVAGALTTRFCRLRMLSELVSKMLDRFPPEEPGAAAEYSSRDERSVN